MTMELILLAGGIAALWLLYQSSKTTRAMHRDLAARLEQQSTALDSRLQQIEQHISAPAAAANSAAVANSAPVASAAPVAAPEAPPAAKEKISEDKLMIIGGVLACHFGKRVKVRSARLLFVGGGSNVWSQQGRAAVQASHRF